MSGPISSPSLEPSCRREAQHHTTAFQKPKARRQTVQSHTLIGLQKLGISEDPHLADVESCVGVEDARGEEEGLFEGCWGVVSVVRVGMRGVMRGVNGGWRFWGWMEVSVVDGKW